MNVNKYLERINFKGDPKPDLNTLRRLQENHLYNIPFENLDIHYKKKINTGILSLQNKTGLIIVAPSFPTEQFITSFLEGLNGLE
ncbi:MAG: arylamine N-acetyltransferase [Ignavibacteria bacterium]